VTWKFDANMEPRLSRLLSQPNLEVSLKRFVDAANEYKRANRLNNAEMTAMINAALDAPPMFQAGPIKEIMGDS
jgi:hypothetical protein